MQVPQTETDDLFRSPPSYLPRIQAGETLFSWGARYHRLSGNPFARRSSLQLFGVGEAGSWFDFPSSLDQLHERTNGILGATEDLLERHTIFGLFARFLAPEIHRRACALMRDSSRGPLKSVLGLLASRAGATPPLRACPDCVADDVKEIGYTFWRLEHQWPTVWVCRKHGRPLGMLPQEFATLRLRQWPLPDDVAADAWCVPDIAEQRIPTLCALADWAEDLAGRTGRHFDQTLLRYTYLAGAKRMGLTYPDGSVRQREVIQEFQTRYAGLAVLPGFAFLDIANTPHGGFVGHMTRKYSGHRHPTKNILLMALLFDSFDSFLETYSGAEELRRQEGAGALTEMLADGRARFRAMVEERRHSISRAAREIGVSITQAVRWAKTEGIPYTERRRVLAGDLETQLRGLLERGLPRDEIGIQLGIKPSFIRSYLASDPELREKWRQADFIKQRDVHRDRFVGILEQNPGLPMKAIKRIPGNGFQWLQRHDREWLLAHLPMLSRPAPCPA